MVFPTPSEFDPEAPVRPNEFSGAPAGLGRRIGRLAVVDDPRRRAADLAAWAPRYRGWRLALKRAIDVVGSALLGLLLLPVLLAAVVVVAVTEGRPVFYSQDRVGRHGRTISVRKIRTMEVDSDARLRENSELFGRYVQNDYKLADDPRVTTVGRTLRRLSIDELPQLLNVFVGEMSIVGPRPVIPDELGSYGELAPGYLVVRPGLTGIWQVSGRNEIAYPERAYLDVAYAREWSLSLDARILAKTIPTALSGKGVS